MLYTFNVHKIKSCKRVFPVITVTIYHCIDQSASRTAIISYKIVFISLYSDNKARKWTLGHAKYNEPCEIS